MCGKINELVIENKDNKDNKKSNENVFILIFYTHWKIT